METSHCSNKWYAISILNLPFGGNTNLFRTTVLKTTQLMTFLWSLTSSHHHEHPKKSPRAIVYPGPGTSSGTLQVKMTPPRASLWILFVAARSKAPDFGRSYFGAPREKKKLSGHLFSRCPSARFDGHCYVESRL